MGLYPCSLDVVIYIVCIRTKNCNKLPDPKYCGFARILVLRLGRTSKKEHHPLRFVSKKSRNVCFCERFEGKKRKNAKKKNV